MSRTATGGEALRMGHGCVIVGDVGGWCCKSRAITGMYMNEHPSWEFDCEYCKKKTYMGGRGISPCLFEKRDPPLVVSPSKP